MPDFTLEDAEDAIGAIRSQVDLLSEILAHNDISAGNTPNVPAGGIIQYSAAGQHSYVSAADGNAYNTGRLSVRATSAYVLTATLTTIPGMSAALAAGTYRVHAQVILNVPNTAGQGALTYRVQATNSLAVSNGRMSIVEITAAPAVGIASDPTPVLGTTVTGTTPNTAANDRIVTFDGVLIVSVAGTLNIQVAQAATAACNVIQYGTYMDIMPAT